MVLPPATSSSFLPPDQHLQHREGRGLSIERPGRRRVAGGRRVGHADNSQGQRERSHDCYRRKGLRSYRGSANEVSRAGGLSQPKVKDGKATSIEPLPPFADERGDYASEICS